MLDHVSAESVRIPDGSVQLDGDLVRPERAAGLVIFAHGSGSSRFSPRNRQVAHVLEQAGFATLLLDLLTPDEEAADRRTAWFRFDIARLAGRMIVATDWASDDPRVADLPLGYFGASTGAAAALVAAAARPARCAAVVSRGGRPDLADEALSVVAAPTLLMVGAADIPVLELNRKALRQMRAPVQLEIVEGATHLFEEPGALETVERLAVDWYRRHLRPEAHHG